MNLKTESICGACHTKIKSYQAYNFNSQNLCEDCCIDMRTPRVRKTHWQYIKSVKTEYLIPSKK